MRLKNNGSPGPDGIPADNGKHRTCDHLFELQHMLKMSTISLHKYSPQSASTVRKSLYSDLRKKYIGAHLHSCPKLYCSGIFFKSLSYLYEVVRTDFSADFWTFHIFDRNFTKFVAPPSKNLRTT